MAEHKTINGEVLAHRDFMARIVETIADLPEHVQTVQGIVDAWDDAFWGLPEQRTDLTKRLAALAKRKLLSRVAHGRYRVLGGYRVRGLGANHQMERVVVKFLRANGGIGRWRDIKRHLGVTEKKGASALRYQISTSSKVCRDFSLSNDVLGFGGDDQKEGRVASIKGAGRGRRDELVIHKKGARLRRHDGYFNLPVEDLEAMILQGRWVGLYQKLALFAQPATGNEAMFSKTVPWDAMTDRFLRRVGVAFGEVRQMNEFGCYDVAEKPRVALAIDAAIERLRMGDRDAFKKQWPEVEERRAMFLRCFEGGNHERFDAAGEVMRDSYGGIITEDAFQRSFHIAVRNDFYHAVADVFNISSAALSRGLIMPAFADEVWDDAEPVEDDDDYTTALIEGADPYDGGGDEAEPEGEEEIMEAEINAAFDDFLIFDQMMIGELSAIKQRLDRDDPLLPRIGAKQNATLKFMIDAHRNDRVIWVPSDKIEYGLSMIFQRGKLENNLRPLVENGWLQAGPGAYRIAMGMDWGD